MSVCLAVAVSGGLRILRKRIKMRVWARGTEVSVPAGLCLADGGAGSPSLAQRGASGSGPTKRDRQGSVL